jgi:hypothetical protein
MPSGRQGAVLGLDGRVGTENMPGVFAQIGMEYGHRYGGTSFELFAKIARRTTRIRRLTRWRHIRSDSPSRRSWAT